MALTRNQRRKAWRAWYRRNRKRKIGWQARRRAEHREILTIIKRRRGCLMCDEARPECLQFHHRDEKAKDFDISAAIFRGLSLRRILLEIQKCDILCGNCHLKHHARERRRSRRGRS